MHWGSVLLAGLLAAVATQISDWLFYGVWMHGRYLTHPEVWRPSGPGSGYARAIQASAIISALASFAFVALLAWLGLTGWAQALALAAGVWLCVPLPMLITNTMLMKLDPWLLLPHGLGALAKLVLAAAATAWLAA